jgi:hypothetical protein
MSSPPPPGRLGSTLLILLLVCALAPIAIPFIGADFPQGHDATAHITNLYRFDRAFTQGQVPVRWVEGIRDGRGQPLFNFYQVGFYYFTELIHQLGVRLSVAIKAAPVLLWWLGAVFMYFLLRPYGIVAAAAGTLSFALSPYLIVDVFVRAAYPEFAALVFSIATLWATDSFLRTGNRASLACVALALAMTLVCHLPATIIVLPMFVLHAAYHVMATPGAPARLSWLSVAVVAGAGIAAFYLVPALAELPLISIRRLTQDTSDYHRHFVPLRQWTAFLWNYEWNYRGASITDPADLMPAHVNLAQWIAIAAALCVVVVRALRRRADATTWGLAAWLAIAGVSLFMMNARSVRVWDAIPPLAFIQFPWRFFLLVSIAGAVLTALLVSTVRSRLVQVVLLLLVAGFHLHMYERRLRPDTYIPAAEMRIDYPLWRESPVARRVGHDEIAYDPAGATAGQAAAGRWTVVSGDADVKPARTDDGWLVLAISSAGGAAIRIDTPVFPGWKVRLDGVETVVARSEAPEYMVATVPPGLHVLDARFENTPVRQVANVTSLVALLLVPLLAFSLQPFARRIVVRARSLDPTRDTAWPGVQRE